MKQIADIIQILLTMPGAWGFAGALLCVLIFAQSAKFTARTLQGARWIVGKLALTFHNETPKGRRLDFWVIALYLIASAVVFAVRVPIHDGLQALEQKFISPVYAVSDTSAFVTQVYELELSKHCSTAELQTVKQWTAKTAAEIGCSPLDIYEVAFVECGLDPFCVRTDGGAAGWIQFTNTGLDGFGFTLSDVKAACKRRDAEFIMKLTHDYLTRPGCKMPNAAAVYVCVAAFGHAGKYEPGQVLYTRSQHPNEYRANSALWDGWTVENGKVLRLARNIDGVITVGDLAGCLAAKKSQLLKRFEK